MSILKSLFNNGIAVVHRFESSDDDPGLLLCLPNGHEYICDPGKRDAIGLYNFRAYPDSNGQRLCIHDIELDLFKIEVEHALKITLKRVVEGGQISSPYR